VTAVALVTLATFTDIVAYSIAIPVLPDFSRRLGASPTTIGVLFGSFGITLLASSIPMGAVSDRIGRRWPMVGGLAALAASTLLFAFATSLPWLFAARLVQGAADAVTWVVGFALIADLYAVEERGRMTGFVMSGTMVAVMVGPTLGGWLYEVGGLALPFFAVTVLAALGAAAFLWIDLPRERTEREVVPISAVVRTPAIAMCAVTVVAASGTISMMEPLLALHLESLGIGPGRIGTLFGLGAVASTFAHPLSGRVADRFGAGRLTLVGLLASAVTVPLASQTWSFQSGVVFFMLGAVATALMVTPSLTFMGEATSAAGIQSFGVAYGLYNMAWGVGLLGGPSLGGFLYDRVGFSRLALGWAAGLIAVTVPLAVVQSKSRQAPSVVTKR